MRTSVVFRLFLVCVAAIPATLFAQGGQAPAPVPSGQAPITPLAAEAMFTVAVAMAVVEAAPIHIANQGPAGAGFRVIDGGVRTVALLGAHAAGNATTQMLRVLGDNPNVRLLFTLVDGNYRIVAKRSAGINRLADLKGKRVVVPPNTSANYYLVAMLRAAGLQESDVTLVTAPATAMAAAMVKGEADAISMWEPESENAVRAIGKDAIIFQDNKVYRELSSVYSTTDVIERSPPAEGTRRLRARDARRGRGSAEGSEALLPADQREDEAPAGPDRPQLGAPWLPAPRRAGPPGPDRRRREVGSGAAEPCAAEPRGTRRLHRHDDPRRSAEGAVTMNG